MFVLSSPHCVVRKREGDHSPFESKNDESKKARRVIAHVEETIFLRWKEWLMMMMARKKKKRMMMKCSFHWMGAYDWV